MSRTVSALALTGILGLLCFVSIRAAPQQNAPEPVPAMFVPGEVYWVSFCSGEDSNSWGLSRIGTEFYLKVRQRVDRAWLWADIATRRDSTKFDRPLVNAREGVFVNSDRLCLVAPTDDAVR